MTTRKFHAQQQKKISIEAFEITHPAFGVIRYAGGQFFDKTLTLASGKQLVFSPIQMKVGLPNMNEFSTLSMKIDIGRVGSQVKKNLTAIDAYNVANPNTKTTPFTYYQFIDGVEAYSLKMWVKSIALVGQNVAIIASDDNPAAINVAEAYTSERFPGMAVQS